MRHEDRLAVKEVMAERRDGRPHGFRHFIYVPARANAESIARKLRQDGFEVECRLGADRSNWLVLVRHLLIADDDAVERLVDQFTQLAEEIGGEYDGWEAEVR